MSRMQLRPTKCVGWIAALCLVTGIGLRTSPAGGQQAAAAGMQAGVPAGTPQAWAEAAAQNELGIIDGDGTFPLRYRVRKVDAKGDTTREVIETREGAVARLIERNGTPLTASEDSAERERLQEELASPSDFVKHRKRDSVTRRNSIELIRIMPKAMINTYAPGQPQPPGATSRQVVLDFRPNPSFKPPTMMADLLTGFEGRVWIDSQSHCMTRIEGRILHPVNFGFGLVAHIYPGGTVEFEQVDAGDNRWVYSHLATHLTVRVIVKTVPLDDQMTAADFHILPAPVSFQDGIRMLLSMPSPVK